MLSAAGSRTHAYIPMIGASDPALVFGVPGMAAVAWLSPARFWPTIARWFAPVAVSLASTSKDQVRWIAELMGDHIPGRSARDIQIESMAGFIETNLQLLRMYRPGGWNPTIGVAGAEHLEAALRRGQGVILWVGWFNAYSLVAKMALHRSGYAVSHLSHPRHGYTNTRFAIRFINPVRTIVEDRYLRERVVMSQNDPSTALTLLQRRLTENGVVSIAATPSSLTPVSAPFLAGRIPLAPGAPSLAALTGATLLPVFPLQQGVNDFSVKIEPPIEVEPAANRRETVESAVRQFARRLEPYVLRYPGQWCGWH